VEDNHKRIERIYRQEGLQVRRRKRKRVARVASRRIVEVPEAPNERWSMDFMHDSLMTGRQFKVLTIVDDFSKESPAPVVGRSIGGHHVADILERLGEERPLPREIVMDNGPEFTSLALDQWAHRRGIHLRFIKPGRPVENCFVESFNGRFRDECLNENWFVDMKDAKRKIEAWRVDYNTTRPHSSLGQLTPEEFLNQLECQLQTGP
jgi:putative transposase